MHEVALVSAALEQAIAVAREAGARRIQRLGFALAAGGHVSPEAVETLVEALAKGTLAEGAEVAFEAWSSSAAEHTPELCLVSIDVDVPTRTSL